ncbi:MAG: hypothetical protein IJK77_08135 [Lachnospiraceae bacterium]|nr:hypothetical protein [Lachnospiraceae bacterium]
MPDLNDTFIGRYIRYAVYFILGWFAVDYIWKAWVNHVEFQFNTVEHLLTPLIAAAIYTLLDTFRRKKQ